MARQVQKPASGNSDNTGAPGPTPAPTKRVAANLDFGGKGDQGYGRNRFGGPSSLTPGQTMESALATDLRTTAAAGGDDVLSAIQQKGTAAMSIDPLTGDAVTATEGVVGSQLRKIAAGNVPVHPNMSGASPGPKVPGALVDGETQPVRKP